VRAFINRLLPGTLIAALLSAATAMLVPGAASAAVSSPAAPAPTCVTVTHTSTTTTERYIATNRCHTLVRVRFIFAPGPDTTCLILSPGKSALVTRVKPVLLVSLANC
jgi:hypothetical protein